MSDEDDDALEDEEVEGEEGEGGKKKKIPGKLIVAAGGGGVALIALIVTALFFFGILGGGGDEEEMHADQTGEHGEMASGGHGGGGSGRRAASEVTFVELPEMLVNLNTTDGRIVYLKLQVAIELPHDVEMHDVDAVMPRVVDQFQLYLRELRLEDLQGSAGMFRLKEELLRRVNAAVAPVQVYDVLFREMIIQ